jgi:diguanylate cyclase
LISETSANRATGPLLALIILLAGLGLTAVSVFIWPDWPRTTAAALWAFSKPEGWQTVEITASGQIIKTVHEPFALARNVSLIALSLVGVCLGGLQIWARGNLKAKPAEPQKLSKDLERTSLRLDGELAEILRLVQSHLRVNNDFSESLDRAHRDLPISATSDQVRMTLQFLIAENEKMQRNTRELKSSLEQSRTQILELRSNLAQAQELGMRDSLTELRSRRFFDVSIETEIEAAHAQRTPLSLVMADIDHFKRVNDTFGHPIGDQVLKIFSSLVLNNVKGRDVVARYGGEEFALILPQTDLEGAKRLTEQIRTQLESKRWTVKRDGQPIGKLTASFGVAQLTPEEDSERLIRRADAKLYEAKKSGRNRVVATP